MAAQTFFSGSGGKKEKKKKKNLLLASKRQGAPIRDSENSQKIETVFTLAQSAEDHTSHMKAAVPSTLK